MPFAIVKGLRINYEGEPARRKGKLLLFVHGASGSLNMPCPPTLLLYGREDMLVGQAELLSSIPYSQVGVIEDAAHVPTVEQPDRFNAALAMFIGTLSP